MLRKGYDAAPDVMTSGKAGEFRSTRVLQPDVVMPAPRTPEDLNKLQKRHRSRTGPGEVGVHWGLKETSPPDPGDGYGIKCPKGEDVAENFRSGQLLGVAEYLCSRGESIYQSTVREPLGQGWMRGHNLPDETKRPTFPGFGKPTPKEITAKETMFPRGIDPESKEARRNYVKTHGSFEAGEMVTRDYKWPERVADDPHFHFGLGDAVPMCKRGRGAKTALTMDQELDGGFLKTTIVRATSEQYRQVAGDRLGTGRNMMQNARGVPHDHRFGIKSDHEDTAAALVRGLYSDAEQLPDHDLGRCTVRGRQNRPTKTPLGVPTVRLDLPAPPLERRRVCDTTNYGDEKGAFDLIYPSSFKAKGVSDEDFLARRSSEELRGLAQGAGVRLEDADFEVLYKEAARLHNDGDDRASLDAFMAVYGDWVAEGSPPLASFASTEGGD